MVAREPPADGQKVSPMCTQTCERSLEHEYAGYSPNLRIIIQGGKMIFPQIIILQRGSKGAKPGAHRHTL